MSTCSCTICRKECSTKGISIHHYNAHTAKNKEIKINYKAFDVALSKCKTYYTTPNRCDQCNTELNWFNRNNKFCGHGCSAIYSNSKRVDDGYILSKETKSKITSSLYKFSATKTPTILCVSCGKLHTSKEKAKNCCKLTKIKHQHIKQEIVGMYTKIFLCTCKHCAGKFYAKSALQYCTNHRTESRNNRMFYKFNFNVYDFPELFDLDLLNKIGFYAPGGKSGNWNPNGMSRDHKVSVSDAIKFGYDRFYISHPLNCELMPHKENTIKKGHSSISYSDLVKSVDMYEQNKL
jgi:hypothetical protein